MAVKFKKYQSKRNGTTNGKWYARVVTDGTVTTDELADIMQDNCTVKRADILAVISELVETMRTQLQNSKRVKIDRLGAFKMAIHTSGANTAKEFTTAKNIKSMRVVFQPETTIDANGNRIKQFVNGAKAQEATEYSVEESAAADGGDSTDNGGSATDGE